MTSLESGKYYSLSDFNELLFTNTSYTLDPNVVAIFNFLEQNLVIDSGEYIPKNVQSTNFSGGNAKRNVRAHYVKSAPIKSGASKKEGTDWTSIRSYKTTQMTEINGIEKNINDIRVCLNKLSTKNYDAPSALIFEYIQTIVETCGDDSDDSDSDKDSHINQVAQTIFDIASSNKFFSNIYARLYKELLEKYTVFNTILMNYVSTFISSFNNITYVDPTTNYDGFCEYTQKNDKRKATAAFISNLLVLGVINQNTVIDIILKTYYISIDYMKQPEKQNEVEEIAESIHIFISLCQEVLQSNDVWKTDIIPNMKAASIMKANEYPSLTNRTIFKYLDIVGLFVI
jgi:hypothetical protein